eukprot:COSAG02_NODE_468_length_21758_cov_41.206796_21_plen_163_part_00
MHVIAHPVTKLETSGIAGWSSAQAAMGHAIDPYVERCGQAAGKVSSVRRRILTSQELDYRCYRLGQRHLDCAPALVAARRQGQPLPLPFLSLQHLFRSSSASERFLEQLSTKSLLRHWRFHLCQARQAVFLAQLLFSSPLPLPRRARPRTVALFGAEHLGWP